MKSVYKLLVLQLSVTAMACIDPPTPFTMKNSSFESAAFTVSASGLEHNGATIFYNREYTNSRGERVPRWCVRQGNSSACNIKPTITIKDEKNGNRIIGVVQLDNEGATAVMKQVKAPYRADGYEIDDDAGT